VSRRTLDAVRSFLARHPGLAYTLARFALFAGVLAVLTLLGARGIALLLLAIIISALLSLWLLAGMRDAMAAALAGRMQRIRTDLDDGAGSEDAYVELDKYGEPIADPARERRSLPDGGPDPER
jgi:hypothetical protein